MTGKTVCAVIVSYNDASSLINTVENVKAQVGRVLIIDNASRKEILTEILEIEKKNQNVSVICNFKNMGISSALNTGIAYAKQEGYKYLLTLDQDTELSPHCVDKLLIMFDCISDIGIAVPKVIYRGEKRSEREIERKKFHTKQWAITSGNLIPMTLFDEIGLYDEKLVIDSVDFDFSLRVINAGYKIVENESVYMLHSLGKKRIRKIGSFSIPYNYHNSMRNYYIQRNHIYIVKKYWKTNTVFCIKKTLNHIWNTMIGIICYPDRKEYVNIVWKGTRDGVLGKWGFMEEKEKIIYLISPQSEKKICNYMLDDFMKMDNVKSIFIKSEARTWYNFFLPEDLRRKTSYFIWKFFKKGKICKNLKKCNATVVFVNEALPFVSYKELAKIKSRGRLACVLIDPLAAKYSTIQAAKKFLKKNVFDVVLTFDPRDAKKYGYQYCNSLYSSFHLLQKEYEIKYDLFYFGSIKDREERIIQLIEETKQKEVKARFLLSGCTKESRLPDRYRTNGYIPYERSLEEMNRCKCILDITQEKQTGITLRYYEAVVYNKKLLTNNRWIKKLPYYDERYMKIYSDIKEIDWKWVKEDAMPDYGYKGDFSSKKIMEYL